MIKVQKEINHAKAGYINIEKRERGCTGCGKVFKVKSHLLKKLKNKVAFCSSSCYGKWRSEKSKPNAICDNCNVEFY